MAFPSAGSIAFIGFNADGTDGVAFVAVDAIPPGQTIYLSDNEWNGTAFADGQESVLTWVAPAEGVPAGSVIQFDNLAAAGATANVGTVQSYTAGSFGRGLSADQETVYAYVGSSPTEPTTFLSAITNSPDGFSATAGSLTGTGLTAGSTAISLQGLPNSSEDIAAYNGPRTFETAAEAQAAVNDTANWISQDGTGDQGSDGTAPDTPLDETAFAIACFCRGTRVSTPRGEVDVENLVAGDRVTTLDGTSREVLWIGRRAIAARFADPIDHYPIRVRAGALDENVPRRDLLMSPDHALLVQGVLVQAGALVNGASITRLTQPEPVFTYYHIELEDHALVLVEGAPAETFVDNVARQRFDNYAEYRARFGDNGARIPELDLPRVKAARQLPGTIREQLAARAEVLGFTVEAAA